VKATFIEIDRAVPPGYWYAGLAGQRLWAAEGRECLVADCWQVLPGQGIADHPNNVILAEHAWQVREGEVALVLLEIEPVGRKRDLGSSADSFNSNGKPSCANSPAFYHVKT